MDFYDPWTWRFPLLVTEMFREGRFTGNNEFFGNRDARNNRVVHILCTIRASRRRSSLPVEHENQRPAGVFHPKFY